MNVHPFKTQPKFERAPWGRKHWPFPTDDERDAVAEISLIHDDATITERIRTWGPDLLGRAAPIGRIPYAARWLGADRETPIHVVSNDADAHKAWYIVEADKGAHIHRGLKPGATIDALRNAPTEDDARALLQPIPVKRGQCYYIAPGVPHSLGPGVILAEIQSATARNNALMSNDPSAASPLDSNDSQSDIAAFEKRTHVTSLFTTVTRLITSPAFYIERVRFMGELEQDIPYAELVTWMVLEGTGAVRFNNNESLAFAPGDCVILPANLRDAKLWTDTDCVWLEITIPIESDLAAYPRPDAAYLQSNEGTPNHPIPLNISIDKKK